MWAIDPGVPSPLPELARDVLACGPLGADELLGWSSDGLRLLVLRHQPDSRYRQPPFDRHLYVVHADGTKTKVGPGPVRDAAISPDGSRVAFTTKRVPGRDPIDEGLFVVDVAGGQPMRIAAEGTSPTFSPDGRRLAYLASPPGLTVFGVTGSAPVWVVNVDGSDAREILADEAASTTVDVKRIKWSPVGDRILMMKAIADQEGARAIYTFAVDGTSFTKVIALGWDPHWSPDGSRITYSCLPPETCSMAIADADGSDVRRIDVGRAGPWHPRTGQAR
jgi:Tol biopolymer transport system component